MIDDNNTVITEFKMAFPDLLEQEVRDMLALFLFTGEDVHKKINVLSGGEKVRLQLCKIFAAHPNVLILDEPTNHMDIGNKEYLEEILKNYKGTLIFVSHDRYFIKKCAESVIVFNDNNCEYLNYGYDKYLKQLKEQSNVVVEETKEKKVKETKVVVNNNTYELKKELKILEREIMKKEIEVVALNNELTKEEVYTDIEEANRLSKQLKEIQKELDKLNVKWEKLTDKIVGGNNE